MDNLSEFTQDIINECIEKIKPYIGKWVCRKCGKSAPARLNEKYNCIKCGADLDKYVVLYEGYFHKKLKEGIIDFERDNFEENIIKGI
jgi:hypothetical protein